MKRYQRCILGTCCVPWNEDYSFAEDIFRRQVQLLLQNGTRNLYIFGTAGEGYAVSDRQFEEITRVFCEEMKNGGCEPMVGVVSLSLTTIVSRIRRACEMGARYFQISLPSWGACTFDEIRRFFAETCGKFDDCSFLHYNNSRTKRMITPQEYALLAEEFPNFVATKNGNDSLSYVVSLLKEAGQLQHFLTENSFTLASMLGLEAGLLISIASVNWKTAKLFYQACTKRDIQRIADYSIELNGIVAELFKLVGNQGHMDGVYDKIFSKMADESFPLRLLPPYSYAGDETYRKFVEFIRNKYPNWA